MNPTAHVIGLDPEAEGRSHRRVFLTAGIGAIAAAALNGIVNPHAAAALSVVLGGINSTNKTTTIRNTKASSTAKALIGRTTYTGPALNAAGVFGQADGTNATGVWGTANKGLRAAGVYGASTTGSGVLGFGPTGVYGYGGWGVYGYSEATDGIGLVAEVSDPALIAIAANASTANGTGVSGVADAGASATGIYGMSSTGKAGFFEGDVEVTGELTVPAALLQVDHPEAPGERWYRQALVGAFERVTVLSGNAVSGPNGRVTVRVPGIFERTHQDVRYQVTAIGRAAAPFIARELAGGRFTIDAGVAGVRLSWQLTGVRDDASARRSALTVEAVKRPHERGRYVEPSLYGRPRSRGLRHRPSTGRPTRPERFGRPERDPDLAD
jgi:hypothetical protein